MLFMPVFLRLPQRYILDSRGVKHILPCASIRPQTKDLSQPLILISTLYSIIYILFLFFVLPSVLVLVFWFFFFFFDDFICL